MMPKNSAFSPCLVANILLALYCAFLRMWNKLFMFFIRGKFVSLLLSLLYLGPWVKIDAFPDMHNINFSNNNLNVPMFSFCNRPHANRQLSPYQLCLQMDQISTRICFSCTSYQAHTDSILLIIIHVPSAQNMFLAFPFSSVSNV